MSNTAGGTVTGTLHIHIHNDPGVGPLTIDHLAITLTGRAQTDIDHSTKKHPGCIFQARRLLFATKKTLIKDSTTTSSSSPCTWEFEVQIPPRCTAREAAAHAFRRWDRFDPNPRQRLPPAFASDSSSSAAGSTPAANAAIIYELRASALVRGRGQGEGVRKLESTEPIDFTTTRDVEWPMVCQTAARAQVALRSARLLPQEPRRRLHVPRRLKAAASSDPPPFAAFELVLRGFRAAIIGQPFPLDLRIAHDEDDGSASRAGTKPRVFLSHVKVSLRAHTSVRCSGRKCFKEKGECAVIHKGDECADWEEEIQIDSSDLTTMPETDSSSGGRRHLSSKISSRSPGLPIPVDDDDDTSGLLDLHRHTTIPTYFIPSFRSFLISRNYSLVIDIAVNCAGKTFSKKFVTRNFLLLAQEYAPRPPSLKAVGSQRTSQTLMDEDRGGAVLVPKLLEYA
ncbi:MAG: hypothetical protein L6R37_005458 [Teloschistes peruensis]|nr:MAG: hypothetical protein L6R37_005458 [Teloschistes peruensis]